MCAKVKFPLWEPKKGPKFYNASGGHQTAGPVANLKALKASLQKVNCWGNVLIKVLNRSKELLFFPLWEPKKSPNFLKPPAALKRPGGRLRATGGFRKFGQFFLNY